MYHRVGEPTPKGFPYRGLTVRPPDFKRQMTWLRRFGYRGLAMRDLMPYIRGERQGKVVGITFDDGYRNVFENALPILKAVGFTATNYFVARQLGGGNAWDYEKGIPHSDLMSIDEMRAWAAAGHEVGSHTLDHPFLPKLSPEVANYQVRQSKAELEQALGAPVTAFCYPYGGESPSIRAMVRAAGYASATTTARGLARHSDDIYGLPRIDVDRSTNIFVFLRKCMTRLEERRRAG
ncbi:polysaccharide deacetylase family protein [Pollutimonas bauzanensis]|uniref:Polysaccharide deacetylase n=1 Tax=Pollutimonas bauzanensis TaxID=658167 RepID=A0A1M5ZRD1_9BURK|nr:polysaccharide deacetylase family protein [Pollutimonas bauzanensis]SHI26728.1 Polysaccharide deacetylase [Pollutimonas bauzanensis]